MELLYVFLEDHMGIKNCGFNLSSAYHITEDIGENAVGITIEKNSGHLERYFDERLMNVTGIIGRNGTGKTNLLQFLNKLLSNSTMRLYYKVRFIAVFKDGEHIRCYHSLFDFKVVEVQDMLEKEYEHETLVELISEGIPEELRSVSRVDIPTGMDDEPHEVSIPELGQTQVIYYNPLVDLSNIPARISWESMEDIDVSTNALLEKDAEDIEGGDFRQIEKHKIRNAERQFRMIMDGQADLDQLNIPDELELSFNRTDVNDRNLHPESGRVFVEMKRLLNAYWLADGGDYHERARKKAKVLFLDCLMFQFFDGLAHLEQHQLNVLTLSDEPYREMERFDSLDELFYFVRSFFGAQDAIQNEFPLVFMDAVWEIFDNPGTDIHAADDKIYVGREEASKIMELQLKYMIALESTNSVINFNWRNMSSGEKAFLDIFSRLHFAKEVLVSGQGKRHPKNVKELTAVYVMIDEGEVGFHPLWQQQYFNKLQDYLLNLFADIEVPIQLFVTSHSPFLLSDLPAENVLMMDKVAGVVTARGNLSLERQTMAANILELYDDTFFLENGNIGEYARIRINDFIHRLNAGQVEAEAGRRFISAIGDEMLRSTLMDELEQGYSLEDQIVEAEVRLSRLKQSKSDQN